MLERPPVRAPRCAVATAHPLATSAGLRLLAEGGSAADAVVAAGAALCVVEPWASHLGGDAFALVWDDSASRARALQGSGAAPARADAEALRKAAGGAVPVRGALPITVPGIVGAWFHLLASRGRSSPDRVLAPAIQLAEEGFPIGERWTRAASLHRPLLAADPLLAGLFLSPDGRPLPAGARVVQPDLARSLRRLADEGPDAFYRGNLGRSIVKAIEERGGWLSLEDLAAHDTEEIEPLAIDLDRSRTVLGQPPVSQGAMLLGALRVLWECERRGLTIPGETARAQARETHLQVEALRLVREWRDAHLGDPRRPRGEKTASGAETHARSVLKDLNRFLDPVWARSACESLSVDRPRASGAGGAARDRSADTTSVCASDGEGNLIAWIQSIYQPFGAGWTVPGTGILLNDRMRGFSLDPASPNLLAPGKRPVHTLHTWMVLNDGEPWLAGSTPGAETQVSTNLQVLRRALAGGGSALAAGGSVLAEAVHAPRWHLDEQDRVRIEDRMPGEVRRRLRDLGHATSRFGPWEGPGFVQAIERLAGGAGWLAVTDPRGEGQAAGI
ncbi:MAG: gamma-glutamyltransferase family protein [Candidatus Eisenbacteria bacterium]